MWEDNKEQTFSLEEAILWGLYFMAQSDSLKLNSLDL